MTRTDAIVQTEENKLRIAIELVKRQSKFDKKLHLNVSVDSSRMYLTREGAAPARDAGAVRSRDVR